MPKKQKKRIVKPAEANETGLGNWVCFNLLFWLLLIGLVALPVAGTILHIRLHSGETWLTYVTLFDAVVISLLYFNKKSIFYGFALNTVFFIVGVIAHFAVLGIQGLSDVLISLPDFVLGYALWVLYKK